MCGYCSRNEQTRVSAFTYLLELHALPCRWKLIFLDWLFNLERVRFWTSCQVRVALEARPTEQVWVRWADMRGLRELSQAQGMSEPPSRRGMAERSRGKRLLCLGRLREGDILQLWRTSNRRDHLCLTMMFASNPFIPLRFSFQNNLLDFGISIRHLHRHRNMPVSWLWSSGLKFSFY